MPFTFRQILALSRGRAIELAAILSLTLVATPLRASFWYFNDSDQAQTIRVEKVGLLVVNRYRAENQTPVILRGYYDLNGLQTYTYFDYDATIGITDQSSYTFDLGTTFTEYVVPPNSDFSLDDDRDSSIGGFNDYWMNDYPPELKSSGSPEDLFTEFEVGRNIFIQAQWFNTMQYRYTYSASVIVAPMTSPSSNSAAISVQTQWSPTFSGGTGGRGFVFCVAGLTHWQSSSWVPPGPGTYTFFVGLLAAPGYQGNLNDPRVGSVQCNGQAYTVTVR